MKKLLEEFKAFIMRGNVVDMAVGVIIATLKINAITNRYVNLSTRFSSLIMFMFLLPPLYQFKNSCSNLY